MSRRMKKAFAKKMEEMELTKKTRVQIDRYRRQYKVMEGSRLAYNEQLGIQLEKQRDQLGQLENEKKGLKIKGICLSESEKLREAKIHDKIDSLMNQKMCLENSVHEARRNLLEISSEIVQQEAELDRFLLKQIEKKAKEAAFSSREMKTTYIESQLSMETVELNKLLTKNRQLREEIESLLKERRRFKEILDSLLLRLRKGKSFTLDLMEQGTLAFEHREEAQSKLHLLQRRMVTLKEKHAQEMRDLDRELEDCMKSADFLTTKGQSRGGKAAKAVEEEERRGVAEAETNRLQEVYNQVISYFPGVQDATVIVEQYLITEDENFAIFNYVNEVNCEAEGLQLLADELKKKLKIEEEIKKEQSKQQKLDLNFLQESVANKKIDIKQLEAKYEGLCLQEKKLFDKCTMMYHDIRQDPSSYERLLEERQECWNIEFSLKLLEKLIRETLKRMKVELPKPVSIVLSDS